MSPLRLRQVHKAMTRPLHIGLLGAMPEEIGSDLSHLKQPSSSTHGDLTLHQGVWGDGVRLTLAWSGWGKVCAARAATRLLAAAPIWICCSSPGWLALPMVPCSSGMWCWRMP